MAAETAVVSVDAGELRVVVHAGDGPDIVLLPGFGSSASRFGDVPERLAAEGFRVLVVNPRGVGGSSDPVGPMDLHACAADVAEVIVGLTAPPCHVLGWAFGNRVARCLATDRPDLVASLVLVGCGGLIAPDAEARAAFERLTKGDGDGPEEAVYNYSPSTAVAPMPAAERSQVAFDAQRAALTTPLDEWWDGGSAPVLVVQGLDDRIAPPANGRALQAAHPDRVTLVELSDAGHALVVEQPDALVRLVVDHVRFHQAPSAG